MGRDVRGPTADRGPITPGILEQGVVLRQPDRAGAALRQIVSDNAGDLPALAAARAIAEEEALAEPHGAWMVVADDHDLVRRLTEDPRPGQQLAVGFARVDHRLELGVGDLGPLRHRDGKDPADRSAQAAPTEAMGPDSTSGEGWAVAVGKRTRPSW